jgi:hypothetical protein
MKVKLKRVVDEMDMQMDDYRHFLHKETGEIVTVSVEELSIAEDSDEEDDFSAYPDWQQDSIRDALDININWEKYLELPAKYEIHEYSIMEDFCGSIENDRISNALCAAIAGKGAFRQFKDAIVRYRVDHQWYALREAALREIAIGWCKRNKLEYEE